MMTFVFLSYFFFFKCNVMDRGLSKICVFPLSKRFRPRFPAVNSCGFHVNKSLPLLSSHTVLVLWPQDCVHCNCLCLCVWKCGRVVCAPPLQLWRFRHSDNWVWPSFIGTVLNQLNPATQSFMISLNLCLPLSPPFLLSLTHPCCLCIYLCSYLMLFSFNKPCLLARH